MSANFYLGFLLREWLQKCHRFPSKRRGRGVDELRPEIDPHAPPHVQGYRGKVGPCRARVKTKHVRCRGWHQFGVECRIERLDTSTYRTYDTNVLRERDNLLHCSVEGFDSRRNGTCTTHCLKANITIITRTQYTLSNLKISPCRTRQNRKGRGTNVAGGRNQYGREYSTLPLFTSESKLSLY